MSTPRQKSAWSLRARAWEVACGAICAADGLVLLACVVLTAQLSFQALNGDEWRIQYDYVRQSLPAFVLTLQNGHSVVFPNLMIALNNTLFEGRSLPLVMFALAANLGASSLLAARMWRTSGRGVDAAMAVAISSVLLMSFWPESLFMVFWAISVENYLCVLGAVAAMLGIARLTEGDFRLRSRAAALAAAGAVLSTFSFGIGVCVWPALLIALLAGRAPGRVLTAFAALAMACVAGFAWAFPGKPTSAILPQATHMAIFLLRYLGVGLLRPVLGAFSITFPASGPAWVPGVEMAIGAAGLFVMLAITVGAWRSEPSRRALHVFCAGLLWFVAGGAALTCFARLSARILGELRLGMEQSVALRYGNWRTLFWQACLVYGLSLLLGRMPSTHVRRAGVLLLGLAVVAIVSANLPGNARLQVEYRSAAMRGAQSLAVDRSGREEEVWELIMHPVWWGGRESAFALVAAIERRRLNLFSEPWMRYPGRRLDDAFAPVGAPGRGGFRLDGSRSSPGVVALEGWSWDPVAGAAFHTLAIVLDDVVVGVGNHVPMQGTAASERLPGRRTLTLLLGRVWDQAPRLLGLDNAWIGLARIPVDAVSRLRFYGMGRDGRAHPLVMEAMRLGDPSVGQSDPSARQ